VGRAARLRGHCQLTSGIDIFEQARAVPFHKLLGIENKSMQMSCPFPENHDGGEDKHPSAHYYQDMNRVKCFVEDKSWSTVDYIVEKMGLEPRAAAEWLVEHYGKGGVEWIRDRLKRQLNAVESLGSVVDKLLLDGLEGSCDAPVLRRHVAQQREIAAQNESPMIEMTEAEIRGLIEMEEEASDGANNEESDIGQIEGDEEDMPF